MKPGNRSADAPIIGAGPAGPTAAYLLGKAGYSVVVIERDGRSCRRHQPDQGARDGGVGPVHAKVTGGVVVRQDEACPVYDDADAEHVGRLRGELEARCPTLHCVGRNGMHRDDNQDHAIMTPC